jgi:cobalt-precorrin-5B (C1)-methyltransferase
MWPESGEQQRPLRTGLTTGCCATACCVAAAHRLLGQKAITQATVTLPARRGQPGKQVELAICDLACTANAARAATIKDAGDDPDVTHGARVFVDLCLSDAPGIQLRAGEGVGTVTREGLALAVGEPAINPVPRQMIRQHLEDIAAEYGYQGGFVVSVGVEKGEALAQKTMNPRLGIMGGLSILGTTGIVRPFSCAAYIASIHQGIDVALANGLQHIAATTGNSSEAAIQAHYGLAEMALIEMGDFAGAVLKYLKQKPVPKVSLCGGFGKLSKLANGHLDLHSRASSVDFAQLAELAKQAGANEALQAAVRQANTSIEALTLCQQQEIDLAAGVCEAALQEVRRIVPAEVTLEVWAVDRKGRFIGCAGGGARP